MATLPVILFVWLNMLCDTFMTPCLRKLVRVCLAVISLTAFDFNNNNNNRIFKHKTIVTQIFHVKISDNAPFSLQMFVFVHIPPIFSLLLTYSLKINSLLF